MYETNTQLIVEVIPDTNFYLDKYCIVN